MPDFPPDRSSRSRRTSQDWNAPCSLSQNAGDALIEAFADAIARRLESMTGLRQRLLDVHGAAQYLGMTEDAVRHKAGTDIPCVRVDGKLRFDRRDLDRWIDQAPRQGV
jgi:hypothetical protein